MYIRKLSDGKQLSYCLAAIGANPAEAFGKTPPCLNAATQRQETAFGEAALHRTTTIWSAAPLADVSPS